MRARRPLLIVGALATAGALLAGCSSTASTSATGSPTAAPGSTVTGGSLPAATRPACTRPAAPAPAAAPVAGSASDLDVTSFDGTAIRVHWFPLTATTSTGTAAGSAPAKAAPTVLMGPGWSLPGDTNADAVGVLGAINIKTLRDAGFNVLTWDPRGFGKSGGAAMVDSADFEGRDVQALLDWTAAQPGVQLDQPGDPRVGMIGGSYGGGIQLVTAAIDCRVDAIVPVIAWHSLQTSLYKADTVKSGWSGILANIGSSSGRTDPHVQHAYAAGKATGVLDADDKAWFISRGPGELINKITVPTLIEQGTVDTLFTLDEGVTNFDIINKNGVPVSMLWFCGGHGACLSNPGDEARVSRAGINWLKRYVQGDTSVDTGPRFDFVDQNGARYTAAGYPLPAGPPITATGSGTLALTAGGGAGPAQAPGSKEMLASLVLPVTPARATNAVNVSVDPGPTAAVVVGAPQLTITYTGTSPAGDTPTRVFAQLVDEATGLVLGNQITPIAVTLDGQSHTATVPMEIVAFTTKPGSKLTLQLVATTVAYAEPRLGGSVDFTKIDLSLPTAAGLTPAAG